MPLLLLSKGTAASKRSEEVVRTPVLKKLAADQGRIDLDVTLSALKYKRVLFLKLYFVY